VPVLRLALLVLALALSATLVVAVPAVAAKPAQVTRGADPNTQVGEDADNAVQAGNNIGAIIKSWGAALLLGVAGLMGLAALARRNVGEGLTLLGIVVLVGGFIFADGAVKSFVQSMWGAFSGQ